MSQQRTEAVVLHGIDYSETSRIITFLTPDRGRFACMAKGVRRKNSPLAAILDTMNRVELIYYWKDGRSVQQLTDATALDNFMPIKADLERSAFAALPLEIVGKVAHENEPSFALYATLVHGMESLSTWTGDVRVHACWQALQLLNAAGHAPSTTVCVECGQLLPEPKDWPQPPGFAYHGGVTCTQCRADVGLTADVYTALRALVESPDACPSIDRVKGLGKIVSQFAMRQLETDLRSVRVINEMFGR